MTLSGESSGHVERTIRLSAHRFLTPASADPISLSPPQQEALLKGTWRADDGTLVLTGYVRKDIQRKLKRLGLVEKFSSALTPLGMEIASVLLKEAERQ